MAGSYLHCIDHDTGQLRSPESLNGMLETGGDVFEAIEELYGMIWWLASRAVNPEDTPYAVELARQNYTEGLDVARAHARPIV